mmetsp:Transcript_87972/g.139776  ORF Transcript_87972/g.139776 Transcript_87972/m.139776 type:complete len:201 (+) Transcript_87972:105-707(+)
MSPAAQSATAALFAAVAAATGKLYAEEEELVETEHEARRDAGAANDTMVQELREALKDLEKRTAHVVRQKRVVAAECRALDERIAGLAAAQNRRELEVASVWEDLQVALRHAKEVLRHQQVKQEPSQRRAQIEKLRQEVKRQAVAIQHLRKWKDEAKARKTKTQTAPEELAEARRKRTQDIHREVDHVQRPVLDARPATP